MHLYLLTIIRNYDSTLRHDMIYVHIFIYMPTQTHIISYQNNTFRELFFLLVDNSLSTVFCLSTVTLKCVLYFEGNNNIMTVHGRDSCTVLYLPRNDVIKWIP